MQVPEVELNSGHKMPMIGMGSGTSHTPPPEKLTKIFLDAVEVGYRHFDTAAFYATEEPLGRAVSEALDRGLIKGRDEIFITSKLWCTHAHPDLVIPSLKNTLQGLALEYVDLFLVHWPVRLKQEVVGTNFTTKDILPFDIEGTWTAMEECCRLGLAKSVGVSNFGCHKLSQLLENATIPPAVNQVEMNTAWQQQKLRKFCKERGIHVTAYSPLGANGAAWGSPAVMDCPILKGIASARGKSLPQIALRWIHEQGVSLIVKSFNKERMKQNLEIFGWELTEEELAIIEQQIPQKRVCLGQFFVGPDAPHKSLDELWE